MRFTSERRLDDGVLEREVTLGEIPGILFEEARQVTIPLQVLLQWDDEGNDRQLALDLFDAFGSREKTLHANMGGHTGVPQFEGDAGNRFFARHLTSGRAVGQQQTAGGARSQPGGVGTV